MRRLIVAQPLDSPEAGVTALHTAIAPSQVWTWALVSALFLAACGQRAVTPPTALPDARSYIDLEAGWRLSVITPLLQSGGYVLGPGEVKRGGVTEVKAPGFLGYERSLYELQPRGRGVHLRSASAEVVRDGKTEARPAPVAALFAQAKRRRHVRLIYLLRSAAVNHDMAVVSADDAARLPVAGLDAGRATGSHGELPRERADVV